MCPFRASLTLTLSRREREGKGEGIRRWLIRQVRIIFPIAGSRLFEVTDENHAQNSLSLWEWVRVREALKGHNTFPVQSD